MRHIYRYGCFMSGHEPMCMYDTYLAFEWHIWCWYICGNTLVNKSCSLLVSFLVYGVL